MGFPFSIARDCSVGGIQFLRTPNWKGQAGFAECAGKGGFLFQHRRSAERFFSKMILTNFPLFSTDLRNGSSTLYDKAVQVEHLGFYLIVFYIHFSLRTLTSFSISAQIYANFATYLNYKLPLPLQKKWYLSLPKICDLYRNLIWLPVKILH